MDLVTYKPGSDAYEKREELLKKREEKNAKKRELQENFDFVPGEYVYGYRGSGRNRKQHKYFYLGLYTKGKGLVREADTGNEYWMPLSSFNRPDSLNGIELINIDLRRQVFQELIKKHGSKIKNYKENPIKLIDEALRNRK